MRISLLWTKKFQPKVRMLLIWFPKSSLLTASSTRESEAFEDDGLSERQVT
jgi:hypothetical protein